MNFFDRAAFSDRLQTFPSLPSLLLHLTAVSPPGVDSDGLWGRMVREDFGAFMLKKHGWQEYEYNLTPRS
jgi:hypothetical protein